MYARRKRKRRLTILRILLGFVLIAWVFFTIRGFEGAGNIVNYTYTVPLD